MKNLFRLGLFGGLLVAFLYFLRRRAQQETPEPPGQRTGLGPPTYHFDPNVSRKVSVTAPDQKGRPLHVEARPIGPDPDTRPPEGKGIQELIVTVINPAVTDMGSRTPVTTFDPPLVFTVSYEPSDADKAGGAMNLALALYYQEKETWRWQRLATVVDPAQMTLTAEVATLTPLDPMGIVH
ncbi:MAG: hypothetical protein WCF84_17135 [Anaerolineae bacterium]